jgi:glutathione S-transferase
MKLYYWPGACSLSPHIVSREAGVDLQLAELDRAERKTQDGTVLSTVNPKNQVPVLELDNGQRLTEGPVIVQYLADQKPGSGLVPPPGTMERYRVQEWLNQTDLDLRSAGPRFREEPGPELASAAGHAPSEPRHPEESQEPADRLLVSVYARERRATEPDHLADRSRDCPPRHGPDLPVRTRSPTSIRDVQRARLL